MKLSNRLQSLRASSTVAVMNRAAELKKQGVNVLNFSAGEPDFDSPEPVKKAGIDAIMANRTKYVPTAGDTETRQFVADWLTRENKLPGVTADHVLITAGVKMALYLTFQGLFDVPTGGAAAELLLPVPAWVSFAPIAELAGARVVELPTTARGQYKITPEQLRAAMTERTRAVLINSPSNPCSTMYSPAELAALAEVVAEAARRVCPDVVIVSDELYQKIVFGSVPFSSIGAVPAVAERTLSINGPGKAFAMTGWRLGWVSGSGEFGKRFIAGLSKLQGQTVTCVPGFVLPALRAALGQCAGDIERMRTQFAARAKVIYDLLRAVPGLEVARPIGAFYVFPDVSAHLGKASAGGRKLMSAADFAGALLDEQQMAVVPGEDFGGCGKSCIRMSFAYSEEQIREGCARLAKFVGGLR